jgi:hypothetical protein
MMAGEVETQFSCLLVSFGSPSFRAKDLCWVHRDNVAEIAPFQPTCPIAPNPNTGNSVEKQRVRYYYYHSHYLFINPDTGKAQKTRKLRLLSLVTSLNDHLCLIRDYGRSLVRFAILVVRSLAVSLATLVV